MFSFNDNIPPSTASSNETACLINKALQAELKNTDGSINLLEENGETAVYKLTLDIFEDMYSQTKIEIAKVEVSVPISWKPRIEEWRLWIENKKQYDLAGPFKSLSWFGFKTFDESLGLNHIMCSGLYGWKNSDFESYIDDLQERYDHIPQNIETMDVIEIGDYQWLRHIERYHISQEELEICSNDTRHMASYLCKYKGGLVDITFFYQGHDENGEKLKQQEEILSTWHFVDDYYE